MSFGCIFFRICFFLLLIGCTLGASAQKQIFSDGIYSDSIFLSKSYALAIPTSAIQQELDKQGLSPRRRFMLYYVLGLRAYKAGQTARAERYFTQCSLLNYEVRQRTRNVAILYYYRSMTADPDDDETVLRFLIQADSMLLKDFDPHFFAAVRYSIAEEYRMVGKLKTALNWVEEGEKILQLRTGRAHEILWLIKSSLYNQLGDQTHNKSWYLRASNTLDALITRNELYRSKAYKARILAELGVAASNLGNSEKALKCYAESLEISRIEGDSAGVCNQLINVLHEEFKLKHYEKVISMGKALIPRCKLNGPQGRLLEIYLLISEAYEHEGDLRQASRYLVFYIENKEELLERSYTTQVESIGEKYRLAQREEELERTSREKQAAELRQKEKERQLNYVTTALSAVAVLLFVLGIFTVKFNIARRRIEEQSTKLEANNELLTKLIADKEFLFKELHHRVKNNFQLILGFLRLQEKYAGGITMSEFIKQSEMKMMAMSMVHEMLYSGERSEEIDLALYLRELSESIIHTFASDTIDAEAEVRGNSVMVPIDKAIPIGLVTNEILINSLKYAEEDELEIIIELREEQDHFVILIRDNGVGFPENFDPETMNSLGSKAILLLMKQIDAEVSWKNDNGASWNLRIPS